MGRRRAALLVAVASAATPGTAHAYPGPAPLQRPPGPARDAIPGQVVVQFRPGVSAAARGSARGAAGVEVLRAMQRPRQQLLQVSAGQTAQAAIRDLERDPRVAYAQENLVYHAAATVPDDPFLGQLWGLRNVGQAVHGTPGSAGTPGADIRATSAWDRTTGSRGVVVAVVDSGIAYDHPDLAANVWANPGELRNARDDDGNGLVDDVRGWDFSDGDGDPRDLYDHGTHVAGTIGAVGDNGIGVAGVSWAVSLMPVRVLDESGAGTTATVVDGFNYAADEGARVVNASLAGGNDPAMLDAIRSHPDTLFVVAAGNDAADDDADPVYPCSFPAENVVCVAATDQSDGLADFSNHGATSVDLGAPGTDVYSTLPSVTLQEDLESGPGNWQAPAPWARTGASAAGGSYSVTDSPGGDYANDVDTSLTTATPVPMSGRGCRASYDMRLALGQRIDHVAVETSPDPAAAASWLTWDRWDASFNTHGQFYAFTTELPTSDVPQYVRFHLVADGTDTGDGVYLDNIRVGCVDSTYDGTEYGFLRGTSMAAPQVAGAAALALSLKPGLRVEDLKRALLDTGDPLPALRNATVSGRRLNVAALLDTVAPPAGSAPASTATPPPAGATPPSPVTPPATASPSPGNPAPSVSAGGGTPAGGRPAPAKTLADVRVLRCLQSGRVRRVRLRCTLAHAGALASARLQLKRGGRSVARGSARPGAAATLTLRLRHRLPRGRYTLTLVLRDPAARTRTIRFALRVRQ